jgi:CelD/BcsL family acetyltransferase involved in cellulose biosynthesis
MGWLPTVTLSHDPQRLNSIKTQWEELQAESDAWSIFNTWEYNATWWRHFGEGRQLWLLEAHDDAGRLVGIAPLVKTSVRRLPFLRWRQLQFVATGMHGVHLDFVASINHKDKVVEAFVSLLYQRRNQWDVLFLEGLAPESGTLDLLKRAPVSWHEERVDTIPYIALPATFDKYFSDFLSHAKRKKQRRWMRELESAHPGEWSFCYVTDPADLDRSFEDLASLHQAKWEAQGQPGAFGPAQMKAFMRDLAQRFLERGWMRLYCLRIQERFAAGFFAYRYRDHIFDFASGIDEAFYDFKPGHLLQQMAIQEAIETGVVEYDLMLGSQEYKYSWGAVNRYNHVVAWYQSLYARVLNRLYLLLRDLKHALKARVQSMRKTTKPVAAAPPEAATDE